MSFRDNEVAVSVRLVMDEPMDYASSGVDIDLEAKAVASLIGSLASLAGLQVSLALRCTSQGDSEGLSNLVTLVLH